MHNVAPSTALVRRSRQLLLAAFLVTAAGSFLAVVGLALFVVPFAVQDNPSYDLYHAFRTALFLLGGLIAGIGVLLSLRALTWKTDNNLALMTGEYLAQYLDERYTFIRNISKLGLGYLDAMLVGPAGALVFRIVDKEGVYFNDHSKWLKRTRKDDWVAIRFNPTAEVVKDIQRLRELLAKRGLPDMPVYGVIVFTKEEPIIQVIAEEPVVPIANLAELYVKLGDNYLAAERIEQQNVDAIVRLFYRK